MLSTRSPCAAQLLAAAAWPDSCEGGERETTAGKGGYGKLKEKKKGRDDRKRMVGYRKEFGIANSKFSVIGY